MLSFPEVPKAGTERETLIGQLNELRALVLWKIDGITRDQGTRSMVPSATTLLGVVKHLAFVENYWFLAVVAGQNPQFPWSDDDPDADFRIEPDETVDSIREGYAAAVGASNGVIEATDLDYAADTKRGPRSLRWVIVHMIDETARHLGQLDIIREQIDGNTGYLPGN